MEKPRGMPLTKKGFMPCAELDKPDKDFVMALVKSAKWITDVFDVKFQPDYWHPDGYRCPGHFTVLLPNPHKKDGKPIWKAISIKNYIEAVKDVAYTTMYLDI